MKKHETWLPQKTSRAYIHRPLERRICTVYPDFKVTALELNDNGMHYNQRGAGLHILINGEDVDYAVTEWKKPLGGLPVYTLYNRDEATAATLTMTAFCGGESPEADSNALPTLYCELVITNGGKEKISLHAGILPRVSDSDHYLSGEFDTGYEAYSPNVRQWLLCRNHSFTECGGEAVSDGNYVRLKLLTLENCSARWISREEQKNCFEPNDFYDIICDIPAGENAIIRAALMINCDGICLDYDEALSQTCAYWNELQGRVKVLPNTEDENLIALYRHSITQAMQMMQRYENEKNRDFVYARQGDVGRFIWIWEAVHYLTLLDRAGIFDHISDCYRMFIDNWQLKEGENAGMLDNPYVKWDNTAGIMLAGLSYHLMKIGDKAEFDAFKPAMDLAVRYINHRRHAERREGEREGLFTSGRASDWDEIGQHWTYTDAVNVRGLEFTAECYKSFKAQNAADIRAEFEDYRDVIKGIIAEFTTEHHGEKSYNMPHILGQSLEETWQHCFYTDGAPYFVPLGLLDPNSELFEQMEAFYREIGMLDDEHGLAGRMTNDFGGCGMYGNVYYTGVAEYCWITAWLRRGERDKAAKYLGGQLKYNVTPEFIASERYCSTDPFYAPWQPNGSGAGRIGHMLLDFYGYRLV